MKSSEDAELLSGRQGTFRSHGQNSFRAETDLEALQAWLNRKSRSRIAKTTLDTYRREAERFMLWALTERKTALSSIGPPDLAAYEAFLSAPPARWRSKAPVRHASIQWRPLRGPLGPNSIAVAMKVLGLLYRDWCEAGYLCADPTMECKPNTMPQPKYWLTSKDWEFVHARLEEHTKDAVERRTRAALLLLSRCHLRQQEVVSLSFESLVRLASLEAGFAVRSTDGAIRPIDHETWTAIQAHLADRVHLIAETNLGRFESVPERALPLIGALVVSGIREVGTAQPIGAHAFPSRHTYVGRIHQRTLTRFIGQFFEEVARDMKRDQAERFLSRAKSWLVDPSRQTPERRRLILQAKALGGKCHEFVDDPALEELEVIQLFRASSRTL